MLTLKHLTLLMCCASTLAFGTGTEQSTAKIEAGIRELNSKYHALSEQINAANKQIHTAREHLHAAIKKQSAKPGWPMSARLVALALVGFIAWEHKDAMTVENAQTMAQETAKNAQTAWKEREGIARTIKYSVGSAYHQIAEAVTSRKRKDAQQEKAHMQKAKSSDEQTVFDEASQRQD
ncbi:MAG: hypothetical protein AB7F19_05085 [Candidatus Babeliales bacterium]